MTTLINHDTPMLSLSIRSANKWKPTRSVIQCTTYPKQRGLQIFRSALCTMQSKKSSSNIHKSVGNHSLHLKTSQYGKQVLYSIDRAESNNFLTGNMLQLFATYLIISPSLNKSTSGVTSA